MNTQAKISSSTNLLCFMRGGHRNMIDSIPIMAKAGYRHIDLNFCEMMNPSSNIDREYMKAIVGYKDEFGISYNQSHVPYPRNYLASSESERENMDALIFKAFEHSAEAGVDTVVIHPIIGSIEENIEYFERMLKNFPAGMRMSIENMDTPEEISTASEILAIIDGLGRDDVGACLDTGHAHKRGLSLPEEIRAYGKKLFSTHIADNHGKEDEHLMPFFGTIDWEGAMAALAEIGYPGFLTYEIMYFMRNIPGELQGNILQYSLDTLSYLSDLMQRSIAS